MTPKQFATKSAKLQAVKAKMDEMTRELETARSEILRTVKMVKTGETIALTSGKRVIKATYNPRRNAYNLQENGKRIATEVRASIHDIRFSIAMGSI